ncbi:helix-turn-helix transcriptional regulator [Euzebya tangerina]|uniref:helix-turn-helix transcriptional regulator n=1 Tax=Euzebya tangerina TaxID=591198 RepID=UPI000E313EA8|nr:AraC family transcriptional regulator [Euzebya tangerina]
MTEGEWVTAWRPDVPGVREALQARFRTHAYPPHVHTGWTILEVEEGVVEYRIDGRSRTAAPGAVTVLPPGVAHDGQAGRGAPFKKRALYLDAPVLSDDHVGLAVDGGAIPDRSLRLLLGRAFAALADPREALAAEEAVATMLSRLDAVLAPGGGPPPPGWSSHALAEDARARLDRSIRSGVPLATIAGSLGVSRAHLIRRFRATFGVTPHAYVIGRRVELARQRLLDGVPVATAAVDAGFFDQSHLTRHFVRHVGVTPGVYRTSRKARVQAT